MEIELKILLHGYETLLLHITYLIYTREFLSDGIAFFPFVVLLLLLLRRA